MIRRLRWMLAGLCVAGAGARAWSFFHASVRTFTDSTDYLHQAQHAASSTALWAGYKPPLTPFLLKFAGSQHAYTGLELVLAIGCWSLLAWVVAQSLPAPQWLRLGGAGAVLALSLTQPIAQWDRAILSESVAFSLLALTVALGIRFAGRQSLARGCAFLAAMGAWVAVRDSNATVVAGLALLLLLGVILRRLDARMLALSAGALAIAGLSLWSSSGGNRWFYPTAQVIRVRIMATDQGYHWLSLRHPPQLEAANAAREAGLAVEDQPGLQAWDRWIQSSGQRTVLTWLLQHPAQIFIAPVSRPEEAIAQASTRYYAPKGYRPALGPVDRVVWVPGSLVPGLLGLLIALSIIYYHPKRSALVWGGFLCAVLGLPHAWVAWLLNPMETPRHALVAEVQYRLGLVMTAPVAVSALLDQHRARRALSAVASQVPAMPESLQPVPLEALRT